ncbi:MAG: hypothetical protein KKD90_04650 [Candidatus Omnitrophica bacterium]|nr:hypothetical protein [Candidatus Omnitrophota bacterium]
MDSGKNILIAPRHKIFLRFIDVPSMDDAEIKSMAALQAIKEVPFLREEITVSYRNLGVFRSGFSSIMLAIAKKDMISDMTKKNKIYSAAPESIRLETELLYLLLCKKGIINEKGVDLVISIGKDYSELMIIDKTRPVFSRSFKNSGRFSQEVNYSVMAYKKDRNAKDPDGVKIVRRPDIDIEGLTHVIEKNFTVPVNFYELKEDLSREDLPAQIDLVPAEIAERNSMMLRKKELAFTYLLAGFAVLLSVIFTYFKIYQKQGILDVMSLRLEAVEPHVNILEDCLRRVSFFEEEQRRTGILTRIIAVSYDTGLRDISLSDFGYNGGENFYFKGTAGEMSVILAFVKRLNETGYFDLVEIKQATKGIVRGEERTGFDIQGMIKI